MSENNNLSLRPKRPELFLERRWRTLAAVAIFFPLGLVACGGGEAGEEKAPAAVKSVVLPKVGNVSPDVAADLSAAVMPEDQPLFARSAVAPQGLMVSLPDVSTTPLDAVRLADQASFGATESLLATIQVQGAQKWVAEQMRLPSSRYLRGANEAVHQTTAAMPDYCAGRGDNCWRDSSSTTPLVWDFYRNAVTKPDQLRQRVAFALQQILVVSNYEVFGTYGFRYYNNMLLGEAFGNYRNVLNKVARSPVMGEYLNNVNNDKAAPNENFARELLQLFSIGTCELNLNGTLRGGKCLATYDNARVREYAFALTGWTYPPGGSTPYGCWPRGANCQFYKGYMVANLDFHDRRARALLSGVNLRQGHSPVLALSGVLDSLMAHPNMAPFVGKQLIQHLVKSNPSPAYVSRVAQAFNAGQFQGFGTGQRGDLAATVAAILLDVEARSPVSNSAAGRLREPALLFTGVLRALNGRTDGDALGWWWGEELRQHVFRSPSVFNFYPPNYPIAGTTLVGPAFGILGTNSIMQRLNFINYVLFWNGSNPDPNVPGALGTRVDLTAFLGDAERPGVLVDRLSMLAFGTRLPTGVRAQVVTAVAAYTPQSVGASYRADRVRQAAYLVFGSPQYQTIR
ncbi:MAG: DUF1800 family protein [Hydrogenophaga sp.]